MNRWRSYFNHIECDGFVSAFLSRDLPGLGSRIPPATLGRFWTMLAHWHGQVWNGAEFGRAFGISHTTVRRYLDLLTSVYVVRQLQPWFENIRKRQVRSPKAYIADSGLLHALLGLTSREDVVSHPKVGASWEGFVIQQVIQSNERKHPRVTRSMRSAIETLGLPQLFVVHAGTQRYRMAPGMLALPATQLRETLHTMRAGS